MRIELTGLFLGYRRVGGCGFLPLIKTLINVINPLILKGIFSLYFRRFQ